MECDGAGGWCPCHEDPELETYPREERLGKHTKDCRHSKSSSPMEGMAKVSNQKRKTRGDRHCMPRKSK
jgi:hypothetical protein